jgi:hypothetical protein
MKILREWLGGSEVINLDDEEQRHEFIWQVVQDEEAGEELIAEIVRSGEVVINDNEPQFLERYTIIEEVP